MASPVGSIKVQVVAAVRPFQQSMKQARQALTDFGGQSTKVMAMVRRAAGLALGGMTAYRVMQGFANAAQAMDDMAKAGDRLGVSSETMANLGLAAKLSGVSIESLTQSLNIAMRTLGRADTLKSARQAFTGIGLSIGELRQLAPDQMFIRIAQAIQTLPTAAQQAAAAQQIFGRSAFNVMDLLRTSSTELGELFSDATRLGGAFARLDLRMVERMNDRFTEARFAIESVWQRVVIDLAPALEGALNEFVDWFAANKDVIRGWAQDAVSSVMDIAGALAAVADEIYRITSKLGRLRNDMLTAFRLTASWAASKLFGQERVTDVLNMWPQAMPVTGPATGAVAAFRNWMLSRIGAARESLSTLNMPQYALGAPFVAPERQPRYTFGLARPSEYPTVGGIAAYFGESRVMREIKDLGSKMLEKMDDLITAVDATGELD